MFTNYVLKYILYCSVTPLTVILYIHAESITSNILMNSIFVSYTIIFRFLSSYLRYLHQRYDSEAFCIDFIDTKNQLLRIKIHFSTLYLDPGGIHCNIFLFFILMAYPQLQSFTISHPFVGKKFQSNLPPSLSPSFSYYLFVNIYLVFDK